MEIFKKVKRGILLQHNQLSVQMKMELHPVISFSNSSNVKPIVGFAATLAIGKPVAFDASAEDLETRGFISMITKRPFWINNNWTFDPQFYSDFAKHRN